MSSVITIVRRLVASIFTVAPVPTNPETMTLRDWADLPAHHPLSEQAPC